MKKKSRLKKLIKFLFSLTFFLLLAFSVHITIKYLIGEPVFSNKIIESYLMNFCLGYVSYIVLFLSFKKRLESLGYIFMYTSFAKFICFFLIFKPYYSLDQNIDIGEFSTIMIPYGLTLIAEIFFISKELKS